MDNKKKYVACLTLGLTPVLPVLAADAAPEQKSTLVLPEIVVVGKRMEGAPAITYHETTQLDFAAWNATTVADALTQTPGVNVQYGAESGEARAWIRGFRDRSVLVLFDGIPVASGFEGTIDLNEIAIENVSRIKTMTAAPSVIYGTNGIGGVIDVVPEAVPDQRRISSRVELGDNDARFYSASFADRMESLGVVAAASHSEADDYRLSGDYTSQENQPGSRRVNSDYQRRNLFLRVSNDSERLGQSAVLLNLSDNERGTPPQAGVDDPDFERLTESKRSTVGLSHTFAALPVAIKLFRNHYDYELVTYTDASYDEIDAIERAEDYAFGGKAYATIGIGQRNTLVASLAAIEEVYEAEEVFPGSDEASLRTYNAALEDEWWVSDDVSIALRGIYTYFDQTEIGESSTAFNPQLVASWQLSSGLSLRASAAQRSRFPKLRELYRLRYGNPDLNEEVANSYEIGLRRQFDNGIGLDMAVFTIDLDGMIDRPTRNSRYQNLDDSEIRGFEVSAGGWVSDQAYLRAGYTLVDAAEELPDGSTRQLRSRPEHTVTGELRYRFPNRLLLSLNAIYVDGLHDLDGDDVYTKIPSYVVAHVKASLPLGDALECYASVGNVADEDYEQKIGYPREGRTVRVGLQFDL
jgi:outer membrane cobalamin receptor